MNAAKQSPRLEDDGTLRWYAGDTFTLTFNFTLKDSAGNVITPSPTDKVKVTFSKAGVAFQEFESTGSASISMVFTDAVSARFPEGVYGILVKYNGTKVTTLLKNSKVVVE